jgi:hypothetical protein
MCHDSTVTPQNNEFNISSMASISRTISVFGGKRTNLSHIKFYLINAFVGFPTQAVDPVSAEGTSIAGVSGYTDMQH